MASRISAVVLIIFFVVGLGCTKKVLEHRLVTIEDLEANIKALELSIKRDSSNLDLFVSTGDLYLKLAELKLERDASYYGLGWFTTDRRLSSIRQDLDSGSRFLEHAIRLRPDLSSTYMKRAKGSLQYLNIDRWDADEESLWEKRNEAYSYLRSAIQFDSRVAEAYPILSELYLGVNPDSAEFFRRLDSQVEGQDPKNLPMSSKDLNSIDEATAIYNKMFEAPSDIRRISELADKFNSSRDSYEVLALDQRMSSVPRWLRVSFSLCLAYLKKDNNVKASELYREVLAIDPYAEMANRSLISFLLSKGDYASASNHLARAFKYKPEFCGGTALSLFPASESSSSTSRVDTLKFLQNFLSAHPRLPQANLMMGSFRQDSLSALLQYETALGQDTSLVAPYFYVSVSYADMGRENEALALVDLATKRGLRGHWTQYINEMIGNRLVLRGRVDQYLKLCKDRSRLLDGDEVGGLSRYGGDCLLSAYNALSWKGKSAGAVKIYKRLLGAKTRVADSYVSMIIGSCYAHDHDTANALAYLKAALLLNPNSELVKNWISDELIDAKQYNGLILLLEGRIAPSRNMRRIFRSLAIAHEMRGDSAKSVHYNQIAAKLGDFTCQNDLTSKQIKWW